MKKSVAYTHRNLSGKIPHQPRHITGATIFNFPETPYCRPAIPVTLALMAGIALGESLPGFAIAALPVMSVAVVRLMICLRRNRTARCSPLLASMSAGYLALAPWVTPLHGPGHIVKYLDTGYWRIHATVVEPPVVRIDRIQLVLGVDTLEREGDARPVRGRIRLTVMGQAQLVPGDQVTFAATIRPFRNFRNPGGFDYRRYMAFQGIHGSAWIKAEKLRLSGSRSRSAAGRLIHDTRQRLARIIDSIGGQTATDERAVLKALVFGDRSGIDDALRERFNRAGVGHLLAISGLHVGIVAGVAFGCLRWIFSFFPPLLWRGWGRQWAAAVALVPVLAYGVLAGMSPSTQRAEIMAAVLLAALILGRGHDTLNTLALAALVILALFPPALFSISFQLSFAAVLAIVYGLGKIPIALDTADRPARRAGMRLLGLALVSAWAIVGTTPLTLLYFNQTSVVGIAANVLLVPLVGFVVVPLGLLSAVAAIFFEPASALGFGLCIEILHLALMAVDQLSGISLAAVQTVTPSLLEIILCYAAGWALLNLRATRLAPWMLAAALVAATGDGIYWFHQRFWHRDLKVTAIDVGQGTSTLLELPGGAVLLADGGGFSDNRLFDMGRLVVAPVLWRKKIASVDILVLSHPNADHLNGLIYIARHFSVRELWTNGDVNTTMGYRELMEVCRKKGVVVKTIDSGDDISLSGAVTLAVLNPPAGYLSQAQKIDQDHRNDGSLVIKATFGQTAFLLTGDITARAEGVMINGVGRELASNVLLAPHHGSRTSSSADLIAAVKPATVVISAGAGNRFGFPHDEVVNRYREAGCRILCTATHGAVSMRSDGHAVHFSAFTGVYD